MFLLPFVLGALSTFSPFIGMVMIMMYLGKSLGPAIVSPQRALTTFFLAPIFVMLMDNSAASQLMVLDAIFGVGFIAFIFLLWLRSNQVLTEAFLISTLVLVLYSMARMMLFGDYISQSFDEGMKLVQASWPQLAQGEYMDISMRLWKMILPSVWGVGQIFALLIGFILFHKMIHVSLQVEDLRFPAMYNLLIVAILPLYLFAETKLIFINALILLCSIPLIQGFTTVYAGISRFVSSGVLKSIIMILILIYAFIPLTLIGFADSWMSIRNTKREGNTT